jgi:formylglycine-generating enzyme required for sulfatase activity
MGQAGGISDERPHEVTLTQPFYMGVYEVTNAQWERVMGSVPSRWRGAERPVENVSWPAAVEFCRKLSALPQEGAEVRVYRLPTEAEWEYACRAGTKTQFWCGEDKKLLGDFGWFDSNSGGETHQVGTKKPNGWGLYDMHGNVQEWCSDWYEINLGSGRTDPQGPSGGSRRVRRGGSWNDSAKLCRSANRLGYGPSDCHYGLGFRIAMSLPGAEPPDAEK